MLGGGNQGEHMITNMKITVNDPRKERLDHTKNLNKKKEN